MASFFGKNRAPVVSSLALTAVAAVSWTVWVGSAYPGEEPAAWQVTGLLLTLAGAAWWAAYRRFYVGAVLGTTFGVFLASVRDYSGVPGEEAMVLFAFFFTAVTVPSSLVVCLLAAWAARRSDRRGET
jgi:hypothetical protein